MEKRTATFETSEGTTLKLRRWSISKFYTLFEKFEDLARALFRVMIGFAELKSDDPDGLEKAVGAIVSVFKESRSKIEFIVNESIVDSPAEFLLDDLLPEDYFDLLSEIVKQNITERAVKKFHSLLGSFTSALATSEEAKTPEV